MKKVKCIRFETLCQLKSVSFNYLVFCCNVQLRLMTEMRDSIIAGRFPEFVQRFFLTLFPSHNYPQWAVEALDSVNITLQTEHGKQYT